MRTCLSSTYTSFSDLVISLNRTKGPGPWGHQNSPKLLTLRPPLVDECNQNINNPPELYRGYILPSIDSTGMCAHGCAWMHVWVPVYLCVGLCAEPLLHQYTVWGLGWNGPQEGASDPGAQARNRDYSYHDDPWHLSEHGSQRECPVRTLSASIHPKAVWEGKARVGGQGSRGFPGGGTRTAKSVMRGSYHHRVGTRQKSDVTPHIEDGYPRDRETIAQSKPPC